MATVKAVELIVSGEVQGVGYRGFVTRIARKLKLVGFAENLEDGTVKIQCKGEAESVDKFKELIKIKNPPQAPLIEVESISETPLKPEQITERFFKERFGEMQAEMSQWQMTGMAYLNAGFGKMNSNFQELGVKYGKITETMGQVATTMTEISKNTKKLVQVVEKKDIFD